MNDNHSAKGIGPKTDKGYKMLTNSGKAVYPLHLTADDICIEDIAHALSNICRYNGHTKRFYSVAEHSCLVARLCPPELFLCGLMHDAPEAYIGDHIRPIKALMPDIKKLDDDIWAVIAEKFNLPAVIPDEVHHADMVALAIERRDVIAHPDEYEWGELPEIPDGHTLNGVEHEMFINWHPSFWKFSFLEDFDDGA